MSDEHGFSKGLAGVIADTTSVSQVQGEVGRLIYRGISIEDLAAKSTFEECVFYSLYGKLPTKNQLAKLTTEMVQHRVLPKYVELHNYSATNAIPQKIYNWKTLNRI